MNKLDVLDIIKKNIIKVLGTIPFDDRFAEQQLKDLGADSIDRVDIMTMSIEDAGLNIPLVELGRAKTIQDIADILSDHIARKQGK